ncbi:MAG: restriction endonuclease subunit S [Planctomycetales bacterium]
MTKAQALEPKIRFDEYGCAAESSYESKSFEDIFVFSTGKNIKQAEASPDFATPCVRYGELYHMYAEVITTIINRTNVDVADLKFSDGDEILLPSAGEDPLDIGSASALTIKEVAIGRTINVLKPKEPEVYDQKFASYYINQKLKKKISTLARGASISNVYNSDLRKLEIHLPTLPEQRKIADFLTAVDGRIQELIQKKALLEDYKKGVMQQLFTLALRFKDDHGNDFPDWEEKRFYDLLDDVLDFRGRTPLKLGMDWGGGDVKSLSANNVKNGYIDFAAEGNLGSQALYERWMGGVSLKKGDIVFTMEAPLGQALQVPDNQQYILSQRVVAFKTRRLVSNDFLLQLIWSADFQEQLAKLATGSTAKGINQKSLRMVNVSIPSVPEQTKIANFLTALDRKIESVASQITLTQTFKRGLLQQMFV